MKDVHTFIAEMKSWPDDQIITVAVLTGVVTRSGPDAKVLDRALNAEFRRRRLGGHVAHLIAAAKAEGDRMLSETSTAHLPDGSAILRMPGGATATVRHRREDEA